MNAGEALETFEVYLDNACPVCKAPVGKLCVLNNSVWVHLERIELVLTPLTNKETPAP